MALLVAQVTDDGARRASKENPRVGSILWIVARVGSLCWMGALVMALMDTDLVNANRGLGFRRAIQSVLGIIKVEVAVGDVEVILSTESIRRVPVMG